TGWHVTQRIGARLEGPPPALAGQALPQHRDLLEIDGCRGLSSHALSKEPEDQCSAQPCQQLPGMRHASLLMTIGERARVTSPSHADRGDNSTRLTMTPRYRVGVLLPLLL